MIKKINQEHFVVASVYSYRGFKLHCLMLEMSFCDTDNC